MSSVVAADTWPSMAESVFTSIPFCSAKVAHGRRRGLWHDVRRRYDRHGRDGGVPPPDGRGRPVPDVHQLLRAKPDEAGKKHARNVYAHTREECEEKLKVLIAEMKAELAELKRQKADRH